MLFRNRPRTVMLELTNLCNLRCVMCGIWSERPHRSVAVDAFQQLVEQRAIRNAPVLALTGGEPFMMPGFEELYRRAAAASKRSHINVSTNGWYSDRTIAFLEGADRRRLSLTISYDGVRSHDVVRRVEGSRSRLLETATQIRHRYPEVRLSLKMTVTNDNHAEILETARECAELGIPFRFKTLEKLRCHQSRSPSDIDGPDYDEGILRSITEQGRAVLGLGIETNAKYIRALLRKHEGGSSPCGCSSRTVFVGVDGHVFLCRRLDPIGNVAEQSFDEIWRSPRKKERIREMAVHESASLGLAFTND